MQVNVDDLIAYYDTRWAFGSASDGAIDCRWKAERRLPDGEWLTDRIDFHPDDVDDWSAWETAIHDSCADAEVVYDRNYEAGRDRCSCGRWMEATEGRCADCGRMRDDE